MTTIYLIRHGECDGNRENLFRGRADFPLNDAGLKQSQELGHFLRNIEFDAVYSSPRKRARQTASFLRSKISKIHLESGFDNIELGEWEGKSTDEIKNESPELWKIWLSAPESLSFPGFESFDQVASRSLAALKRVINIHPGQTVAIVSHSVVLRILIARVLEIAAPYFWKIKLDNASFSILEHHSRRGFTLAVLNFCAHLSDFYSWRYDG